MRRAQNGRAIRETLIEGLKPRSYEAVVRNLDYVTPWADLTMPIAAT